MFRKILVPVMSLSLGVFSATMFSAGCGRDKPAGGTGGGKGTGGAATGGKGAGGSATGGAAGKGAGGSATGGAAGKGAGGISANGGEGGSSGAGAGGSSDAGVGGSAGAGGSSDAGVGGSAGAGGSSDAGAGGSSGAGGGVTWPTSSATACPNPYNDIPAADFCAYYTTTCGTTSYASGAGHFVNEADCLTKYATYSATVKGCTAYHLCVAGTPNGAAVHCLHPAGGGGNPCSVP